MLIRIACLAIGYLCGLIQTSYIIGRIKGIDIRKQGSGNAGTTNAFRTMGKKAGALTFICDVLKCLLAGFLCQLIFGGAHPEMVPLMGMYAGAGTILGHNFPVYLGFKGGKGIACSMGLAILIDWKIALMILIVFPTVFLVSKYVSLASMTCYIIAMTMVLVMGALGCFGMSSSLQLEMDAVMIALTVLAFYRHRANIRRLIAGTENKMDLFKKKK